MELVQPSFSRGEVSPLLANRVDQQFYQSALKTLQNFIVRSEGGASNRAGTYYVNTTKTTGYTKLVDFVYSSLQAYVLELGAGYVRFYTAGALVLVQSTNAPAWSSSTAYVVDQYVSSGGNFYRCIAANTNQAPPNASYWSLANGLAYEISTPYGAADLPSLRWVQSADTLTLVHPNYPVQQLKRVNALTFSLSPPTFLNGPFLPTNTDGVTFVYASATSGQVTLTASSGIFNANHVGALFQLQQQDFSTIQPWEPNKLFGASNPAGSAFCRSAGNTYKCVAVLNLTGPWSTGSYQPIHTQGVVQDGSGTNIPNLANSAGVSWQFMDPGYGNVLITGYTSPTQVTGIVQSITPGQPGFLPQTVIGGPTAVAGPWTFTGDGSTKDFSPLTGANVADPTKYVVSINGVYQSASTYSVTVVSTVYHVVFNVAPASGASISVKQVANLGQTSYWAFGAFSPDQGYPSTVTYYQDRLTFAGTPNNAQAFWLSKSSNYLNFGVSNPSVPSDSLTFKLNSRQINAINDLIPLTDLIVGTSSVIWRVYPGTQGGPLTPSNIDAKVQNFYGHAATPPAVLYADSAIYVTNGGRKIRDLIYQFQYDKYVGDELTAFARHLLPAGTTVTRMAYAPEPFGQLYVVRSDGVLLTLTYMREQQVVGWSRWQTQGNVSDVLVVPENGSFSTYLVVTRATGTFIEKVMPREVANPQDYFFVDAGLTYDGRNSSSITARLTNGGTWLAGQTATASFSAVPASGGFKSSNVTNQDELWLYDTLGNQVSARIIAVTSSTSATVQLLTACPAWLQSSATTTWTQAQTVFSGLAYLAGQTVSVSADGAVVPAQVVSSTGTVSLPTPAGVAHIGLGYVSQLETLNVNVQGQAPVRARTKLIPRMSLVVDQSQGFMVGPDFLNLVPAQLRAWEGFGIPTGPYSDIDHVYALTTLDDNGHVCVQNSDPTPLTVLGVFPTVELGEAA